MHFVSKISPRSEPLEPRRLLAANPSVIDLLVLYTTQAKIDQGGDAAIQAEIQGVVDAADLALQNSQIPVTIRLVHSQEIPGYNGSGSVQTDELRLQNPSDGFMDSALSIRNVWGADLVHLITNGATNAGGFSQQITNLATANDTLGYSAMDESSLGPANLTLAHELGHNLGAAHARGDPSAPPGPFDYSYGYRVQGSNGAFYHDIMAIRQSGDIDVPLYANPNLMVAGVPFGKPIGDPNEADLSSTFAQTAPIVAGYRATVVTDTAGPVGNLFEMDPSGQTLTFSVRYRDDLAVDASSIDSNDLFVTTPEGFSLSAELLSVTGGSGNTFEKLARYRVTLPTANEPLSSLHVMLRANQVKDIGNHFAAAGELSWGSDDPGEGFPAARDLGTPAPTVVLTGSIGGLDFYDDYKFTLASAKTVSVHLTGMTGDANVTILHDVNNNGVYDYPGDYISSTYNPGSGDRAVAVNLPAGEYFLQVNYNSATAYTLTLNTYTDTTPPTATLDATDVKTAGAASADFAVTYSDDQEIDAQTARYSSAVDIHAQLDNGADFTFYYFPDGNLNPPNPQNAPTFRTIYHIFAFNSSTGWTSNDNGLYTISVHQNTGTDPRAHDAAGNNLPLTTLGSFRIAIGSADTTAPTVASVLAPAVTAPGPTTYDFTVTYHDNVAIDPMTLDGADIRVLGSGGYFPFASFVSVSAAPSVGSNRTVTYRITPPGGAWDYLDDGAYQIVLQPGQVKDTVGNALAAGTIGSFVVHVPFPGDASNDDKTNAIDFNVLATNFGKVGRGFRDGDFNFDGVVNTVDFNTLAAKFNQSLPPPPPGPVLGDLFNRRDEITLPSDSPLPV